MSFVVLLVVYAVVAFCFYKIGYINGRRYEIEIARKFVDAVIESLEEASKPKSNKPKSKPASKQTKKKRGRPVGSKNKPKS